MCVICSQSISFALNVDIGGKSEIAGGMPGWGELLCLFSYILKQPWKKDSEQMKEDMIAKKRLCMEYV